MASKGQLTGMAGVYYAAAELSRIGYIVTPTSRNAQGVDLLIANSTGTRVYSAQVKTNATTFSFWLLGEKCKKLESKTLFYILINLKKDTIDYYTVPSKVISKGIKTSTSKSKSNGKESTWHSFYRDDAEPYKDNWVTCFGDPNEA